MSSKHPFVSETREGKPVFEWLVALMVVLSTVAMVLGHMMAATAILAGTAIISGFIRLVLRSKSPWKVRSVGFDAFIGIALGVGLLVLYFSIRILY